MNDEPATRQTVAVALTHDKGGAQLPRITATGRGAVADQILELAFASGVKVRQDADLAEILGAIDIDSEIPVEAIAAVAEILAYVYRANGERPSGMGPAVGDPNRGDPNGGEPRGGDSSGSMS